MAPTTATMPKARPRQYRDFLTPALHRKFTAAFLLGLVLCYIESILLDSWKDLVWSWFPLGFTGIRTLLLCIAMLSVFFIRVSNNHVGTRTTISPLQTFLQQSASLSNLWLYLYFFSAWFFSEIAIWSSPADAKLGWTIISYGEHRLNERAIFFRVIFMVLAFLQSAWHVYNDEDKISIPIKMAVLDEGASTAEAPRSQIRRHGHKMCLTAMSKAGISFVTGTVVYLLFLRRFLWELSFSILRYGYHMRQYSHPSGLYPFPDIILRILYSTTLLTLLWDFTNTAFSVYIAQEPLKKDQPITAESKDPNGSLIRGLDHRLKTAKSFAFWELLLITMRFPDRRKTIFADIDRQPSTWTQISTLCLREIRGVSDRVKAFNDARAPKPSPETANGTPQQQQQQQQQKLAAVPPLKTDPILAQTPPPKTRAERVGRLAGSFAKQHGLSPGSPPRLLQDAGKALSYAERKLVPPAKQREIRDAPKAVREKAGGLLMTLLGNAWLGWPFRRTFERRAVAVICGSPTARTSIIVDAATALAKLCTESLREDPYGAVAKDIKAIVGVYSAAIGDARGLLEACEPHWTDVFFTEGKRRSVEEVNVLIEALTGGLKGILGAFGEYAAGVGMTDSELAEAKALVGGREMRERKR